MCVNSSPLDFFVLKKKNANRYSITYINRFFKMNFNGNKKIFYEKYLFLSGIFQAIIPDTRISNYWNNNPKQIKSTVKAYVQMCRKYLFMKSSTSADNVVLLISSLHRR